MFVFDNFLIVFDHVNQIIKNIINSIEVN